MLELKCTKLEKEINDLNNWEMWVGKVQDEEDRVIKQELYFIKKNATISAVEQKWEKNSQYLAYLKWKLHGYQQV